MIVYCSGNILTTSAQAIMIPVNTVGVMGKGLAFDAKMQCYDMFRSYRTACKEGRFNIGNLMYWQSQQNSKVFILFPTKKHYKMDSEYEYIIEGMSTFRRTYEKYGIQSVAIPKLGCGLGHLQWNRVKDIILSYVQDLPISVLIYE